MSAGSTTRGTLSLTAPFERTPSDLCQTPPGRQSPGADEFAGIDSPSLQSAARRVASRWWEEPCEPRDAADAMELGLLAAAVERLVDGAGAVDQGVPSVMERMREAIEPGWAQDFTARLSGPDGLELLVQIAHDLRTPLTSILFLAETLQRGQSGPVTEVQRRQLGLIYGAALGLSSVASDVIELTRGGDQLVEKEPEPFSVSGVLQSVRDIVWPIAEEKGLSLRLLPPPTDQRLGHPIALSRVLLNLTTNALKFTDEGYVEIVTRETAPTGVEFAVRDSGKGIDPAVVNSLYEPFRQSAGGRRLCFSDTGLGLTMCRKLVQAMDSELHVETRPAWGTRFYFEVDLPPYGSR